MTLSFNLGITGHRPDKLWGYRNERPALKSSLHTKLVEIIEREEPDYGITGMAQGADQLFAEICLELAIPYVCCVPFSGQESVWPEAAQTHYKKLLEKAHDVVIVSPGPYANWKMQRRNKEIVWQCTKLVAVWDGSTGGTANCVKFAEAEGRELIRINPKEL